MKKILGIFMLIAGIVIAVGASSANFAYFEASRDVHVNVVPDDLELIDLKPMQPYAYINSNGELVIKLNEHNLNYINGEEWFGKGVSPDSLYVFEEVFAVSNHLWEDMDICVTISNSGDGGVSFFTGDYTGEGYDSLTFTVPHGDFVTVGMILNSTDMVDGDSINGDLEITADAGACP
ncbi:MAG: DUF1102 domain-containing protein [Palaeococcus sp.]|nr:DUF1102 domain-containing protein [Palaeococcus sp. (in: euryarchaeotes)]MCD6559292.1 DUF1102 domain-containing protein [Palaeococcus sp. (in: euryarchaeotes)]